MSYAVLILPRADKELDALPIKEQERISRAIEGLSAQPRPPGCSKLENVDHWRIRVGRYRVIYEIRDRELIVVVVRVAHRKEVYR
jgi:mRNA interferase RelE/StbE